MIEVEIEGTNTVLEFPEGTPQHVISATIKKQFGEQSFLDKTKEGFAKMGRGVVEGVTDPEAWRGTGPAVGSTLGLALGLPGGPPLMAGMSGIGAMGGEALEQLIYQAMGKGPKTPQEAAQRITTQGSLGAIPELAQPVISKTLAPYAKNLPTQVKDVMRLAREKNLPISPKNMFPGDVPTKAANTFQWVGDKLPFGNVWGTRKRKQLADGFVKMFDESMEELPVRMDAKKAGRYVGDEFNDIRTILKAKKEDLYKKEFPAALDRVVNMAGGELSMPQTLAILDKYKTNPNLGDRARKWITRWSKERKKWNAAQIHDFQANVWGQLYKESPTIGGDLINAVKADVGGYVGGYLERAKGAHKVLMEFNKHPVTQVIANRYNVKGRPEHVIKAAFDARKPEDVLEVKKYVSKETWDVMKSRFVENLVDTAMKDEGFGRVFLPNKWINTFNSYDDHIKAVMPEIYDTMSEFTLLTKAATRDLKEANIDLGQKMLQTATMAGAGGLIPFAKGVGKAAIAVPTGFSFVLSKSLMNPKGWMKKWLTTGIEGKPIKEGLRLGGRALMLDQPDSEKWEEVQKGLEVK